jgi:LSD1 subclass zinc finger protein
MEQTDLQSTRPETEFVRTFPCTGCGAKLSFSPGTHDLKCEFCGTANAFTENDARVEELDFEEYLKALEGLQETVEAETVKCGKCGAEQTLADGAFANFCAFCRTPIVGKGYASRHVKPRSIIPFQVDRARAQEAFRAWVRGLWLAPNDLKRYAQSDASLDGVYLPFWTYDCRTTTEYRGQRGRKQGNSTTWTDVSGRVECFHDDVVVLASPSVPEPLQHSLWQWDTKALVAYQPEYVSGFRAEAYRIGLKDGYVIGRRIIDAQVRSAIRKDIGGSEQKIDKTQTRYSSVSFKHVLLPVWMSAYRYRDRPYRFIVNGQTGLVSGESPTSPWKVALIALVVLFLVYVMIRY